MITMLSHYHRHPQYHLTPPKITPSLMFHHLTLVQHCPRKISLSLLTEFRPCASSSDNFLKSLFRMSVPRIRLNHFHWVFCRCASASVLWSTSNWAVRLVRLVSAGPRVARTGTLRVHRPLSNYQLGPEQSRQGSLSFYICPGFFCIPLFCKSFGCSSAKAPSRACRIVGGCHYYRHPPTHQLLLNAGQMGFNR